MFYINHCLCNSLGNGDGRPAYAKYCGDYFYCNEDDDDE